MSKRDRDDITGVFGISPYVPKPDNKEKTFTKSQLTEAIHSLNHFNRDQSFVTSKEGLEKYFAERLGL